MRNVARSALKHVVQTALGRSDVRAFLRTQRLWLTKKIYVRPVPLAAFRQLLVDLGATKGRTLWIQSSWNQFYNVPLRPTEMVDLLRDLVGPQGTLAMPAFPLDQDSRKIFIVDRAPTYTGLLCEVFRRTADAHRSIHLTSSVCATGPQAEYLVKDHHHTSLAWGTDTPFCRMMELDARILNLGAGFESMTPLHIVECLLYDEIPYFRTVFGGVTQYRWRRANGEIGEHAFLTRIGTVRPLRLRRFFGADMMAVAKLSNLEILAADMRSFVDHAMTLARAGRTMYVRPVPRKELFVPSGRAVE